MILTKQKLIEVIQAAYCCHAAMVTKYSNTVKYGLNTDCSEYIPGLVQLYISILEEYLCLFTGCECSLIGSWQYVSETYNTGTLTFIDETTVINTPTDGEPVTGTYTYDGLSLVLDIEGLTTTLIPDNYYNFFDPDCGSFKAIESETPQFAYSSSINVTNKWDGFDVFYEGVSIYHHSALIDFLDYTNPAQEILIDAFVEGFNTFNTLGAFMTLGDNYNDLIIQAPNTYEAWNGTEITIGIFGVSMFGPSPFGGASPGAAFQLELIGEPSCTLPASTPAGSYYGPELITNGSFGSNISGWNVLPITNWEWHSSGKALYTGADETGSIFQNILEPGKTYHVSFTYSKNSNIACGPTSSFFRFTFGDTVTTYNTDTTGDTTIITQLTVNSGNSISFLGWDECSPSGTIYLDNVSVREIITVEPEISPILKEDSSCLTQSQIIDIINHLNKLCTIFKCC